MRDDAANFSRVVYVSHTRLLSLSCDQELTWKMKENPFSCGIFEAVFSARRSLVAFVWLYVSRKLSEQIHVRYFCVKGECVLLVDSKQIVEIKFSVHLLRFFGVGLTSSYDIGKFEFRFYIFLRFFYGRFYVV